MEEKRLKTGRILARDSFLFFVNWMFYRRKGDKFILGRHHEIICNALEKVAKGETKRLIINLPPRYSKTELAVKNFIAWTLGHYPDSQFIHTSYSADLAFKNSADTRDIIQSEEYQKIFGTRLASTKVNHFVTTAGGTMYATGAGGSITGFGAGGKREGFSGCFPAGTPVWTEIGRIEIDRIVNERLGVKVWCYDYKGNIVLRNVVDWHSNPPNSIVRVHFNDGSSVECTPCHKFWTKRGWVRADSLRKDDALPRIADRVEPFISGYRSPDFVEYVGHENKTFCLTVDEYHNFIVNDGLLVKNCIIIDDPHKADEALSETMRNRVKDWFQNTLESRKNSKDTPIILIMQRLHEDDLAGFLLNGGNGEKWEHICLPAIDEDGSPLWEAMHGIEELRRMEQAAPYVFATQYMQSPAPLDGGIFKPSMINVIDAIPAGTRFVRGWDLASTVKGDFTAGAKIGITPSGRYVIADMTRARVEPEARDAMIMNAAALDGRGVTISIPQDPGQAGKTQVLYLVKKLAGYIVKTSPESGDKVTRALPFAAQVNVGNVDMIRASWNLNLIEEMRMFPNGRFDDQIDALSRAFSEFVTGAPSLRIA